MVGLGALALGAGELTDAARFDNADGYARRLEYAHDGLFVAAAWLQPNNVGIGVGAQEFEELRMALAVVEQGVQTAREPQLERELGNIEAGIR